MVCLYSLIQEYTFKQIREFTTILGAFLNEGILEGLGKKPKNPKNPKTLKGKKPKTLNPKTLRTLRPNLQAADALGARPGTAGVHGPVAF